MALIHDIIATIDIFSFPVFLNMNKTTSFKSWIGGCGTILMVVCFFLFFWQRFAQFIFMEKVYIIEEQKYDTQPSTLELDKKNFMFAVNVQKEGESFQDFTSEDGVAIDILLNQKHRHDGQKLSQGETFEGEDEDGKTIVKQSYARQIPLQPCTIDHFKDIKGLSEEQYKDAFSVNKFNQWLCPNMDEVLRVGGVFTSDEFLYISFVGQACDESNTKTEGLKCNGEGAELHKEYKFMFYHTNQLVNKNYDKVPVNTYINDFLFFLFKPDVTKAWSDIFFRQYNVKTWEDVLGLTPPAELDFPIFLQGDLREVPVNLVKTHPEDQTDGHLFEINVRRSPFTMNVERSYEKLDQFLAYVGGFIATLIGVFGGILTFFKKKQYLMELSNQIYSFRRDDMGKKVMREASRIDNDLVKDKDGVIQMTRNEYIQKEFKEYYTVRKPLRMTCKYYLSMIFCKKLFYGPEEQLIDVADQKINEVIDIKNILQTINMHQRGQDVTLGRKQMQLLNLIPKDQITKEDKQETAGLLDQLKGKTARQLLENDREFMEQFCEKKIETMYEQYQNTQKQDLDADQKRQNRRIIKQIKNIDPKLLSIFEFADRHQFIDKKQDAIDVDQIKIEEKQKEKESGGGCLPSCGGGKKKEEEEA